MRQAMLDGPDTDVGCDLDTRLLVHEHTHALDDFFEDVLGRIEAVADEASFEVSSLPDAIVAAAEEAFWLGASTGSSR